MKKAILNCVKVSGSIAGKRGANVTDSMKIRWIEPKKLGLYLKEVPGRKFCPKKLVKKRPIDFKGAAPVAKKHKLQHVETTQDADSGERLALDERTTQILEEELQAIMIKVWQALPDNPPTPAERYVTEQLRSEASDDIRNVLGLNVTKRLLNVFNPLSVRIIFPAKPDARDLMEFTKTYHIISEMRPKGRGEHSYFALVARIADFDRLCNSKDVRCGSLTATVYPYYRFSDLPMKLNTGFIKKRKITSKSKQDEKGVADKEINENASNDKIVKNATASSENVQPTVKSKPIVKTDLRHKKTIEQKNECDNNKVTAQSNINKANVAKKADANQKVEQNTKNIATSVNQNNAIPSEPKPNVVKGTQNVQKPATQNNSPKPKPTQITQEANTVKNVNVGKTSTPLLKPKPNQASQAVVATKNVTDATPKTIATTNLTKPKPSQGNKESVATKKVTESMAKLVEKASVPNKKLEPSPKVVKVTEKVVKPAVTKPNQNQVKKEVTTKKIEEAKQKLTIKNVEMINSEMFDQYEEINEDDEMNDEEILALISTGVVVDECSGSDED